MKKLLFITMMVASGLSSAGEFHSLYNLNINSIRVVGVYSNDTRHNNTIELHFSEELNWPDQAGCTDKRRLFIDASHTHLVSAAYMAFASDKRIQVTIDKTFSKLAAGYCQISFIDVLK